MRVWYCDATTCRCLRIKNGLVESCDTMLWGGTTPDKHGLTNTSGFSYSKTTEVFGAKESNDFTHVINW